MNQFHPLASMPRGLSRYSIFQLRNSMLQSVLAPISEYLRHWQFLLVHCTTRAVWAFSTRNQHCLGKKANLQMIHCSFQMQEIAPCLIHTHPPAAPVAAVAGRPPYRLAARAGTRPRRAALWMPSRAHLRNSPHSTPGWVR